MARKVSQVADLKKQVAGMSAVLSGMGAVTIVYGPSGQVLQLVASDLDSVAGLQAARAAIRLISSFVEGKVVEAQVADQVKERLGKGETSE